MTNIEILRRILLTDNVFESIMENEDIIFNIIPMLKYEKGFDQKSEWHCYDVWNHTIKAIENSPMDFEIRLVLLLHDIGKPFSYQDDGNVRHFKGHAYKSREIAYDILENLGFKNEKLEELLFLIGEHATTIDFDKVNQTNIELYKKMIIVQIGDGSAYENNHAREIVERLEKVKEQLMRINDKNLKKVK